MSRKIYNMFVRIERWVNLRFTPVGRLMLSTLIAVGLFALNPRATLAYQLALLVFAIVVGAMLWAPAFRPMLSARRRLPKFATVGVPLEYTLELENLKRRQLTDLEATDEPQRVTSKEAMIQARRRERRPERPRRWASRRVGYMRFVRALRWLEGARFSPSPIERLSPGAVMRVPMRFTPTRRGYVRLCALRLTRADPLGVFRGAVRTRLEDQVLVFPKRYRVSWSGRAQTARHAQQGAIRTRNSGQGADFARLREYRPRDPMRHIHWRAWARLGEPVVKEFHEESPSRNALLLDVCVRREALDETTFEEAVSVAASFVAETGWCAGQLDLLIAGEHRVQASGGTQGESVVRMLEVLACVQAASDDEFATLTRGLFADLERFSACVLVLLDLDSQRVEFVRALQQAQVGVLVLLVSVQTRQEFAEALSSLPLPQQVHVVNARQAERALSELSSPGAADG
jgi:uncharacterized protein (DUF58 family)